jgi:hypothetical protein
MGKTKDLHNYRQSADDYLPDITAQEIDHVRTILGVYSRGGRQAASKYVVPPRPRKETGRNSRNPRKMFARKLAASAFRTARWGRP